jgi:hypothetical protein
VFKSVVFNEPETGRQVFLHVGHKHPAFGVTILLLAGGDPVTVTMEGGATETIPAGSIVHAVPVEDEASVVPRAVAPRPMARKPADGGRRPAILIHSQFGPRLIGVGDTVDGSYVVGIVPGDPHTVSLKNGVVLQFGAGALVRYLPLEE